MTGRAADFFNPENFSVKPVKLIIVPDAGGGQFEHEGFDAIEAPVASARVRQG